MNSRTTTWLVNGIVIAPNGPVHGAVAFQAGCLIGICSTAPKRGTHIDVHGQFISPGFIDLHIWGESDVVAREAVKGGTTAFLTTIGPRPTEQMISQLSQLDRAKHLHGARCLGAHLEGPFINPKRSGALPRRWMRPVIQQELRQLGRYARKITLITVAPEVPGALEAIGWFRRRRIAVSLGHTETNTTTARQAIHNGASLVTHMFNGMQSFHHREPGLVGTALTDARVTTMVIPDGVHVDPLAFQLLLRCKGTSGIILVTDSIRYQQPQDASLTRGAYVTKKWTLAGSSLTMLEAVRNAVIFGKISLHDAIRMASLNPARAVGQAHRFGSLEVGKRADLVVFSRQFRVSLVFVDGTLVYRRHR